MNGSTPPAGAHPRRRARPVIIAVVVVGVAVAVAVVVVAVQLLRAATWQEPAYPSLQKNPDPSVHGTVAYLSDDTSCVRIIAAGGGRSQEVYCLPEQDVEKAKQLGKEQGPQLVWLDDGRLEITMFRMTDPPGPAFEPGWQKLVDVRTGEVENVPDSDAPSEANRETHPMVNADGQRLVLTNADKVELVLEDGSGSRTLLSVNVPPEATYGMPAAFWSPDGRWIAADDGRLLVIVPDDPPVIRVLTDESAEGSFEGELSRFAVTGLDLITPSG